MTSRRFPLMVITLIILGSAATGAQNFMRRSRAPLREPTAESFDGGFTFCRGHVHVRPAKPQRHRMDPPTIRTPTSISVILYALSH